MTSPFNRSSYCADSTSFIGPQGSSYPPCYIHISLYRYTRRFCTSRCNVTSFHGPVRSKGASQGWFVTLVMWRFLCRPIRAYLVRLKLASGVGWRTIALLPRLASFAQLTILTAFFPMRSLAKWRGARTLHRENSEAFRPLCFEMR